MSASKVQLTVLETPSGAASEPRTFQRVSDKIVPLPDQLRSAQTIQRSLLPRVLPSLPGWSLAGCCESAGPVGGDFYDIFALPNGQTMFLVADVMGKGIPAALIASVARTVVRMAAASSAGPGETFARVNQMLYEDLSSADMFVTAQAAWIDMRNQELTLANAGHCPLLLRHTSGNLSTVCPDGIPLGVAPAVTFQEERISLNTVQYAVMYTDGVIEARSPSGRVFGMDALEAWLLGLSPALQSAENIKEDLLEQITLFQAGTQAHDDQTLLLLAREPA